MSLLPLPDSQFATEDDVLHVLFVGQVGGGAIMRESS
jgi:hypothetical protein